MAYSLAEQQSNALPPNFQGKEGQTHITQQTSPGGGSSTDRYWLYSNGKWEQISSGKYQELNPTTANYTTLNAPNMGSLSGAHRYPRDAAMSKESDYVLFEFYKYQPPYQDINRGATSDGSSGVATYNQSVTDESFYKKTSLNSVILYMPEDISTGYRAQWSGKSFSNIARDALATAGSGDFGEGLQNALNTVGTALEQFIPNTGAKLIQETVSKITGESLSNNDIFGATRGVILNPNVELLFSGIDLRNFQLNYKLVPRNQPEAEEIRKIVNVFRKAMLPSFGGGGDLTFQTAGMTQDNFIRVPNVCRVSFMKGSGLNQYVPQYKMCAITQVDVNYTPDGAYATYGDGNMVAIGLQLAFQETKLIFAEEVEQY